MELQLGYLPQVYLLVLFRVMAVLVPILVYGRVLVPGKVMVAIGLFLTLILTPLVPESWIAAAMTLRTIPDVLFTLLGEVLLGTALALILNMIFGICIFAGTIAGWGSSLMMAQTIDPIHGGQSVILSEILQNLFIVLLFISNAHLVVLKMLAASFYSVPPQLTWLNEGFMNNLIALGSQMFWWGVRFGLPIMSAILIVDAAMGLVARMAPDFDILFLSFPIRLITGVAVFGITIQHGAGFFDRIQQMALEGFASLLL